MINLIKSKKLIRLRYDKEIGIILKTVGVDSKMTIRGQMQDKE